MTRRCERCGSGDALVHLTRIVENKMYTHHLCESCAGEEGLDVLPGPSADWMDLESVLSQIPLQSPVERAPSVGTTRIARVPGRRLLSFADFTFSRKSFEQVFEPTVRDLQVEYIDALAAGRRWKARWVYVRGCGAFTATLWAHCVASSTNAIVRVWRLLA